MTVKIDELKALMAKATPGPLHIKHDVHVFAGRRLVAGTGGHQDNFTPGLTEVNKANACLIAQSINALPDLIAAVEAAQVVVADAGHSLYGDETDDPACVDPYLVRRRPIRALRAALAKLGEKNE